MSSPIQHQSGPDSDAAAGSLTAPAYPQLRLNIAALDNNIRVMASWCRQRGVDLAPHVKTTMSAPIIARQVAAGAVGVTVATVDQAGAALGWGHQHVLIANQVVDRHGLMRLRSWLEEDAGRGIRCFVDSAAGVDAAARVFAGAAVTLEVLVDVGTPGGRTGTRSLPRGPSSGGAGPWHARPPARRGCRVRGRGAQQQGGVHDRSRRPALPAGAGRVRGSRASTLRPPPRSTPWAGPRSRTASWNTCRMTAWCPVPG